MANAQTERLFGYSREKATTLMLQVHNEGKAVVSGGTHWFLLWLLWLLGVNAVLGLTPHAPRALTWAIVASTIRW